MSFTTLLLFFFLTACAQLEVRRDSESSSVTTPRRYEIQAFLWGFLPYTRLPPEGELCPGAQLDRLEMRRDSGDVWISLSTLGLYTPYRVDISCAK